MNASPDFVGALVGVLGVMASIAGVLFWRMLTRMENKIDRWWEEHMTCRERQMELFVRRDEFDEWKKSRRDLWARLNTHKHAPNGSVVIKSE